MVEAIDTHYFIEADLKTLKSIVEKRKIISINYNYLLQELSCNVKDIRVLISVILNILQEKALVGCELQKLWRQFCLTSEVIVFNKKISGQWQEQFNDYYNKANVDFLIDFRQKDIEQIFVMNGFKPISLYGLSRINKELDFLNVLNIYVSNIAKKENTPPKILILLIKINDKILSIKYQNRYSLNQDFEATNNQKKYAILDIVDPYLIYDIAYKSLENKSMIKMLGSLWGSLNHTLDKVQSYNIYFCALYKDELNKLI